MFDKTILENLVRKYYPEGTEKQIHIVLDELLREGEIEIHRKIRELVNEDREYSSKVKNELDNTSGILWR